MLNKQNFNLHDIEQLEENPAFIYIRDLILECAEASKTYLLTCPVDKIEYTRGRYDGLLTFEAFLAEAKEEDFDGSM